MNENNPETTNIETSNAMNPETSKANTMKKAKKTRNTSKTLVELGHLANVYGEEVASAYYAREAQIKEMAKDASLWTPNEITRFHAKNWRLLLKGCTMPKFALDCYWNMIPVPETFSQSLQVRLAS